MEEGLRGKFDGYMADKIGEILMMFEEIDL